MGIAAGLWISVGGGQLAEIIAANIERHEQFTTTVSVPSVRPRHAELAVVSMHATGADYLGISQAGRRVATGQRTIVISHLITFAHLSTNDLKSKLPVRFAGRFAPPRNGVYRPTPRLWQEILKVISTERSQIGPRLEELKNIVAQSRFPFGRREGGLEVFERDAVASALQVWGGNSYRTKIMRSANPALSTPLAPFLSQLSGVTIREDPLINHDQSTFPGMEVARRDVVGSVVLRNNDDYLTILNCNRQPLEQTLGVDLIYYNHRFDSFVLVQYKRMTQTRQSQPEYRPRADRSHATEIKRMIEVEKVLRKSGSSETNSIEAFRLSGRPFYIKLCESKAKAILDAGMVPGMYVPLGLWRRLLRSASVRGPRRGIAITWENCSRRLSNGEFTNLLRHGWIGSAAGQSRTLAQIIENVLSSGRMLILASTSAAGSSRDWRRDSLGRFASEDDPDGAI